MAMMFLQAPEFSFPSTLALIRAIVSGETPLTSLNHRATRPPESGTIAFAILAASNQIGLLLERLKFGLKIAPPAGGGLQNGRRRF
jgi:hypothetical protein